MIEGTKDGKDGGDIAAFSGIGFLDMAGTFFVNRVVYVQFETIGNAMMRSVPIGWAPRKIFAGPAVHPQ